MNLTTKITLCDARRISELLITPSTVYLTEQDKRACVSTMLSDLERLAEEDGCVAAAWALEWMIEAIRVGLR